VQADRERRVRNRQQTIKHTQRRGQPDGRAQCDTEARFDGRPEPVQARTCKRDAPGHAGLVQRSQRALAEKASTISRVEPPMRIIDIRERAIAISRYAEPSIPSGGLR
jgi:hypothetical protein